MQIIDRWHGDIPQQFLNKKKIEVLLNAFARQLQEVKDTYEDLNNLTDLNTAKGENLSMLGSIISLSKKDASELSNTNESMLDDDTYRKYLTYKIGKNTNSCTYYDIIDSLKMFWDKPIHYSESKDQPATMILETDELTADDDVSKFLTAPFVKSAGVAIKRIAYTRTDMPPIAVYVTTGMGRGYQSTTLPEMEVKQ